MGGIQKYMFMLIALALCGLAEASLAENIEKDALLIADQIREISEGKEIMVILGEHMSKTERLALEIIKSRYPHLLDGNVIHEHELSEDWSELLGKACFVVGGPTQSLLARDALAISEPIETDLALGRVSLVTSPEGYTFIVVSDHAGYGNLPKIGPSRSPLAKLIPVEYVPAAAAGIGLGLIWIWHFILPILKKIGLLSASSKIMKKVKKKQFNPNYKGVKIAGIRFKLREWLSIAGAAFVFAGAVAWSYLAGDSGFFVLIMVTALVNMLIYSIRHFTRLFMDRLHEIHTEYVFWGWGGIVTILTGWLGTTFALAGYIISDENRKTDNENRILYAIDLFTFFASMVFLIWNFLWPSVPVQMAMVLSMSIAFIQMLPIEPFAGKRIYAWSRTRWWLTFIPMAVVYVMVHIII